MKRPVAILICVLLFVGASLAGVMSLGDREILVASPEGVVEGFMRAIVENRYEQAVASLSGSSEKTADDLKEFHRSLESIHGRIVDVRGKSLRCGESDAVAIVEIETARERLSRSIPLVWERGAWRVAQLPAI